MIRPLIAATALLGLAASSTAIAAPASPAASLSIAGKARAGAPARRTSHAASPGLIAGLVFAAAVVVAGVIVITDDNSDSN